MAFPTYTPNMYDNETIETYYNGTETGVGSNTTNSTQHHHTPTEYHPVFLVIKSILIISIIFAAILGNSLVIISVVRFKKLRIISNSFIASLACADLLVATFVMPFSAIQEIAGTWLFGQVACDIFNANDVLFSTASLLHLCCISIDRFVGVMNPLTYRQRMTKRKVALLLSIAWGASCILSHIPVHTGIYTTDDYRKIDNSTGLCLFVVNKYYAIISSTTSFWTPAITMVCLYAVIYSIARKQEKRILRQTMIHITVKSTHDDLTQNGALLNGDDDQQREGRRLSSERKAIRRENKAAKTLGIIMSVFLLCWLPFFLWYVITNICGDEKCPTPDFVVSILFWVGYLNSALNPCIYGFHNKQFRKAFKTLLHCTSIHRMCSNCCCKLCIKRGWIQRRSDPNRNYYADLPPRSHRPSVVSTTAIPSRKDSLNSADNSRAMASIPTGYETVPEHEEDEHTV